MREAELYRAMPEGAVSCFLCQRRCYIRPGEIGFCHVRKNEGGRLYPLNYGKCASYAVDPIEKKPFYHFMPGSKAFSFAAPGCNFRCEHCFTGGTWISLENGVSTIEALFEKGINETKKNRVFLRNVGRMQIRTATGKLGKVIRVSKHSYTGKLFSIKPAMLPIFECTPEHGIYVLRGKKSVKVSASGLKKGDFLAVPKIKCTGKKTLRISQILGSENAYAKKGGTKALKNINGILRMKVDGFTSRQIAAKFGLHPTYVRAFLAKCRKKGSAVLDDIEIALLSSNGKVRFKFGKANGIPDILPLSEDLASLFGYYCAEGSIHRYRDRPNSYNLRFCLGRSEKELAGEIAARFRRVFDVGLKESYGRTTIVLSCGANILARLFEKLCGRSAYGKKVPAEIFLADEKTIRAFLLAYNKGDGWNKEGDHPISLDTVSKQLAIGLCGLFLLLGILPFYHEYLPPSKTIIEGRTVSQSTLYYVKIYSKQQISKFIGGRIMGITRRNFLEDETHFFVPIKKISTRHFEGSVFNLEVEGEHSYTANFIGVANCQNWEISQPKEMLGQGITPEKMVEMALRTRSAGIAYTYTEPTIFYEYAKDTALLARKKGLYNVFVSNGYMTQEAIRQMGFLDAARLDLKAFDDKFYKNVCGGAHLEPVLKSIRSLHKKMHIEIITLLIPTLNDSDVEIRALSHWVAELGRGIPLHFTGYYPANRMALPPTPAETLGRARKIAMEEGLQYVYTGNRPGDPGENTYCPKCKARVIARFGMEMTENNLVNGNVCPKCNARLPVVFDWKREKRAK